MSLTKKYLKSKPVCKVTFKLTAEEAGQANQAVLLGDFNNWDRSDAEMKRNKKGDFSITLDLPTEVSFHYRYLLDGDKWENDPDADAYERSPIGEHDNSVVQV